MCEQEGELGSCIAGVVSWGVGCATEGIPGVSKHCCFGKTMPEKCAVRKKFPFGRSSAKIILFEQHLFRQGPPLTTFEILFGSVSDNLLQFRGVHECAQVQQLD